MIIHTLVEGVLDEAVASRLITEVGHQPGACYGKKGYTYIQEKVAAFNRTAQSLYYLALVDMMDTKLSCPPEVLHYWLPHRQPKMIFRIVVQEIESWLLADRSGIAEFLKVNLSDISASPEQLLDPKLTLINLARKSKSRKMREALVPESRSTASVGRLYNSEMLNFINTYWNIQQARLYAQSLDRCVKRLESLV